MKQSSLRLVLASAGTLAALSLTASADIVIMKDGKKYESATILSETADSVTFKYMMTPRIPDTMTKPRAEIQQIVKQRPEELEVVPLRKLVPSADLLTADKYEGIIQDQLRPFISKYANSPEAKEIETMIATLQTEKEKVVSGQLKLDGEWLTPDMVKRDGHIIDAYRVRKEMKDLAAKNELREALRIWDKLSSRDEGYLDTEHYVKAIPEATKVLETYKKDLERMLTEQPILQRSRDNAMKSLVEPDLSRLQNAIKAEADKVKAANDLEKKMRQRWLTVYKYDPKGLQAAQKVVVEELTKITALDLNRLTTTVQAITSARRFLADGNAEQAEVALQQATQSVGREAALASIISKVKGEATKLKLELNKKRATQKVFGNQGTAGVGTSGSSTDDRVTKALAEADKAKEEKKEAKEAAAAGGGGLSSLNTPTIANKAGTKKDDAKKPTPRKSTAVVEADESGGFQTYALYGGIALLVALLATMFLQKKKQS